MLAGRPRRGTTTPLTQLTCSDQIFNDDFANGSKLSYFQMKLLPPSAKDLDFRLHEE